MGSTQSKTKMKFVFLCCGLFVGAQTTPYPTQAELVLRLFKLCSKLGMCPSMSEAMSRKRRFPGDEYNGNPSFGEILNFLGPKAAPVVNERAPIHFGWTPLSEPKQTYRRMATY